MEPDTTQQPTLAGARKWARAIRAAAARYAETYKGSRDYRRDTDFRVMILDDLGRLESLALSVGAREWKHAARTMGVMDTALRDQVPADVYDAVTTLAGWS
jgi:hypothetical protein